MSFLDLAADCSDSDGVEVVGPEVDDYDMGFIDDDAIDIDALIEQYHARELVEDPVPLMEEPLDEVVLASSDLPVDNDSPNNPKMGIAVFYRISDPTEDQLIIHEQFHDSWLNDGATNVGAMAWQLERGGRTQRVHIQGLIVFGSQADRVRINALWAMFGVPRGRGTQSTWARNAKDVGHCLTYCGKVDGTELTLDRIPFGSGWMSYYLGAHEWGDFSDARKQGKRADLDSLRVHMVEQARSGLTFEDFVELTSETSIGNPLIRSFSAVSQIFPILGRKAVKQRVRMEVRVFYGDSNTGKTVDAQRWLGDGYASIEWGTNGKLLAYEGQDKVLLNDLKGEFPYHTMIKMLDTTQVWRAPIMYRGTIPFIVKKFAITCVEHPSVYYQADRYFKQREFNRRLTRIYRYEGNHDCDNEMDMDGNPMYPCNCLIRCWIEK